MELSDEWLAGGLHAEDGRLDRERALLVRSYAALPAEVHS
jgi:hypothetical protein